MSFETSSIYVVRNLCLIEDEQAKSHKEPFDGKLDYDYIMWIDSDSVFAPEQFKTLLNKMEGDENLHILSGLYLKDYGQEYAAVASLDPDYIKRYGKPKSLTPHDVAGKSKLIKVAYAGMGFMMVRKGVFESLAYPWFRPVSIQDGIEVNGFASEDASFCLRAKEASFDTWLHPKVIIGHEKSIVLR